MTTKAEREKWRLEMLEFNKLGAGTAGCAFAMAGKVGLATAEKSIESPPTHSNHEPDATSSWQTSNNHLSYWDSYFQYTC